MLEILSEPQRWAIPAVLIVSAIGAVLMVRRERRRPTSYTRVGPAAQDDRALASQEFAEQGEVRSQREWRDWQPDTVADASEAAQAACERMAQINAEFHP